MNLTLLSRGSTTSAVILVTDGSSVIQILFYSSSVRDNDTLPRDRLHILVERVVLVLVVVV